MRALPFLLALLPTALLADDIPLTSAVDAVTLYPQGATVTRAATFTAPAGRHELILTDLPKETPLAAIRVKVDGAVMGGVTARDDFVPPRDEDADAEIAAAEAEVERLENALRDGRSEVDAIRLEAQAAEARAAFLKGLGEGDAVAGMDAAALRGLAAMIGDDTLAALRAAHEARARAEAAQRDLVPLEDELERARQALRALVPENATRAMLAVAVRSDAPAEGRVTVTYAIPAAGWRPVYDLKLDREDGRLTIERGAFLHQDTGENWRDVDVTLSTLRPAERTTPSDIHPWPRRIFDPEDLMPKELTRSEAEAGAAPEPAAGAALMADQATARFDGISVTYSYPDPVSVASGADRVRLALGTVETRADLVAQAVPLNDSTAFLVARVTNDSGELILPTDEAMFYLDGQFIGRKPLDLIPSGGEAELAFGPIDGLQLTRTVLERDEGDRGMIRRSNEMREEVLVEVENLTGQSWPVRLLDRIPYSEQEDLEITWEAAPQPDGQDVNGKRGVLEWEFDLPAGATNAIRLSHRLTWPDGMELR